MLIRSSGPLDESLHLLTLGSTCHYLLGDNRNFALFDPGLSAHVPILIKRFEALGLPLSALSRIFLTHLHADRIAGAAALKKHVPNLKITGTQVMKDKLASQEFVKSIYDQDIQLSRHFQSAQSISPLSFEEFSGLLKIDSVINHCDHTKISSAAEVRLIDSPGHTQESVAYQIFPKNHLIVDEGFGYHRGRELAAPGGDYDQHLALENFKKVGKIEISALCLPNAGVLTGQLVRKHFQSITQNSEDLFSECALAHKNGISDEDIRKSVLEQFYSSAEADPVQKSALLTSFEAIWRQVLQMRNSV